jgi:hypothetical protein
MNSDNNNLVLFVSSDHSELAFLYKPEIKGLNNTTVSEEDSNYDCWILSTVDKNSFPYRKIVYGLQRDSIIEIMRKEGWQIVTNDGEKKKT